MRGTFAREESVLISRDRAPATRDGEVGRHRGMLYGSFTDRPTIGNPAHILANRIRRALDPSSRRIAPGPVTVYRADGTVKAVLDPRTREPIQ